MSSHPHTLQISLQPDSAQTSNAYLSCDSFRNLVSTDWALNCHMVARIGQVLMSLGHSTMPSQSANETEFSESTSGRSQPWKTFFQSAAEGGTEDGKSDILVVKGASVNKNGVCTECSQISCACDQPSFLAA
ncbi:hypothetical protein B0T10DRAFT_235239 [Thelonectria olida]|uniref:Uncharacterized protein n=1 Tax=Thelonectria olida TaxID=1576542 RepID=A0A9P8VRN2_9HYPO|nr:hypothetical protein B0T10DRAFT_235239 [Thelonectria olida]